MEKNGKYVSYFVFQSLRIADTVSVSLSFAESKTKQCGTSIYRVSLTSIAMTIRESYG